MIDYALLTDAQSFQSAKDLGASYIEVRDSLRGENSHTKRSIVWYLNLLKASACVLTNEDVQLTKDDVPVIYHDFLVSETGIDAPLHKLSLEQVIPRLLLHTLPTRQLMSSVHVHQQCAVH